jgi:two-component system, cell cycle sensor histidine kinase and response regulator CckA
MVTESMTALVIDDDADLIAVAKLALNSAGIKDVSLAADGLEAKKIVEAADKPFNVVVCDWVMPGLDGPGFLSFFRQDNVRSPFIMLSGKSTDAEFSAISRNPNDYFLTKQSSLDEIIALVQKVVKT